MEEGLPEKIRTQNPAKSSSSNRRRCKLFSVFPIHLAFLGGLFLAELFSAFKKKTKSNTLKAPK